MSACDVAQARVADDILKRLDRSKLFLARRFRIDAMQLPESDLLKPEPLTAFDGLLGKWSGRPSLSHSPGAGHLNPALVAIRMPS